MSPLEDQKKLARVIKNQAGETSVAAGENSENETTIQES
jgi:hypothetical protein